MSENINLNKEVFNKRIYQKTIDTSFKELGVKTIQEQVDEQPTVQEFFDMYNTLFYNINELGPTNSHEFLIKTSSEYIGAEQDNELINLLQTEIANLRQELLANQQQLANLTKLIPEAPEIETPELDIPEEPEPIEVPTPQSPPTPSPPTNEERVIEDFQKYPKSSIKKRAKRLNLLKVFIRAIKKKNNL
tara:strand:- start:128 stop:697 length:570 start_codon:yes stop_codon:yes gene_type:complete